MSRLKKCYLLECKTRLDEQCLRRKVANPFSASGIPTLRYISQSAGNSYYKVQWYFVCTCQRCSGGGLYFATHILRHHRGSLRSTEQRSHASKRFSKRECRIKRVRMSRNPISYVPRICLGALLRRNKWFHLAKDRQIEM